jgi:hypothetical protein
MIGICLVSPKERADKHGKSNHHGPANLPRKPDRTRTNRRASPGRQCY